MVQPVWAMSSGGAGKFRQPLTESSPMARVPKALLLAASLFLATAATCDMTLSTFLTKGEELKKLGPLALTSSDLTLLRDESKAAGDAYRARIEADKKAKKKPHSCPPPKGQVDVDSDDLIGHFSSYSPAAQKTTTVKTALFDLMKKRYPCKA